MEKNCATCKFYHNGECINKDFRKMIGVSVDDEFSHLTDEGLLSEYIREQNDIYELANIVLEKLYDDGYVKQTKKRIGTFEAIDKYEDFLNNFVEKMDDVISGFVINNLQDVKVSYETDEEFCCKFWE